MVQIRDMDMPTNCAHCPCLTVTADGVRCGTPTGKDQKICADSLYFDEQRKAWSPEKRAHVAMVQKLWRERQKEARHEADG